MSWSFYAQGTKKGVLAALAAYTPSGDLDQSVPALALIKNEIEGYANGQSLKVEASGHFNTFGNSVTTRQLNISVSPVYFLLDPLEPEETATGEPVAGLASG